MRERERKRDEEENVEMFVQFEAAASSKFFHLFLEKQKRVRVCERECLCVSA